MKAFQKTNRQLLKEVLELHDVAQKKDQWIAKNNIPVEIVYEFLSIN